MKVVLSTMNARWSHASFGLRCLKACVPDAVLVERTLDDRASDVVEAILAHDPAIVGLGVYVWNAAPMLDVVRVLKRVRPDILVVIGGPEVSHEVEQQEITARADYVVTGEGELAFAALVQKLRANKKPLLKVIEGGRPDVAALPSPYAFYDDTDVKQRTVYVEASRGCPFTCEFCLSALDDGVRVFPPDQFLAAMQSLLDRGLNQFKFVDRTFNIKIDAAARVLQFFLARMRPGLFLHFEMIPDRLPDPLRDLLAKFPPGSVQLEVGVQTFDEDVAKRIARKQDAKRIEDNLRFLRDHTGVYVHADLIAGLPGESLESFGRGFDRLYALGPQEIQVGVLKRLRGAPIARHDAVMTYSESPPYEILQTDALSFHDVQRVKRFARAVDLVMNSGRFPETSRKLMPFEKFIAFSDWLFAETGARHGIALQRLAELLLRYLGDDARDALARDLGRDRASNLPKRQSHHTL